MKVCPIIVVVDADEVTDSDLDRASWVYAAESADGPAFMQHVYGVRMPDGNVYVPEHHDCEPANAELIGDVPTTTVKSKTPRYLKVFPTRVKAVPDA